MKKAFPPVGNTQRYYCVPDSGDWGQCDRLPA